MNIISNFRLPKSTKKKLAQLAKRDQQTNFLNRPNETAVIIKLIEQEHIRVFKKEQ